MDPNQALKEIRELSAALLDGNADVAEDLAECVQGLDEWLSRGGFLPDAWKR